MQDTACDIAIIGAGVAGLTATARLAAAGRSVVCLEATGRIGGRILTHHDPLAPRHPIELGAEFVHGLPPETWSIVRDAGLAACEHGPNFLCIEGGRILHPQDTGDLAHRLISRHRANQEDASFESRLNSSRAPAAHKQWARNYVEGFNAARAELIGIASLAEDAAAAETIDGDRAFRLLDGYHQVPLALLRSIPDHPSVVHLNSIVERVVWRPGRVAVHYRSALDDALPSVLRCRQLIVTVPLGVLQAAPGSPGAIAFNPRPGPALDAAASLQFGNAYRVTFRFPNPFWEEDPKLKQAAFIVSADSAFRAWWTTHPVISPLLTAWAAGSAADRLRGLDPTAIAALALQSLGRILNRPIPRPDAFHFHDWQADPLFRGAYSYVPVNGLAARLRLAQPVDNTLFFACEATHSGGHTGTVHAAIASGIRAARQALEQK
jgi:monoamine oxidase